MEGRPFVGFDRRGAASWARLDRPEQGNACGSGTLDLLEQWLVDAPAEQGVRALVLTGSAAVFCLGADIDEGSRYADDPDALLAYVRRGRDFVDAFAHAPVPTVAAVNGAAVAGGLELVLAADFAIAVRSARLADGHARHGIVPGWGSSARLHRLAGVRAATLLLTTGIGLGAEELRDLGVLTSVVDDGALEAAVDELVGRLAAVGPSTLTRLLTLARAAGSDGLEDALAREWGALADQIQDPEFRAGVERFISR